MPAELRSTDGQYVRVEILGYEFPRIKNEAEDSNWLMVRVSVKTKDKKWKAKNPCLLTTELNSLIRWLRTVADDGKRPSELEFMEPCLSFEVPREEGSSDERIGLRIGLSHELRDDKSPEPLYMGITVTGNQILTFADSLAEYTRRFPPRGKWA